MWCVVRLISSAHLYRSYSAVVGPLGAGKPPAGNPAGQPVAGSSIVYSCSRPNQGSWLPYCSMLRERQHGYWLGAVTCPLSARFRTLRGCCCPRELGLGTERQAEGRRLNCRLLPDWCLTRRNPNSGFVTISENLGLRPNLCCRFRTINPYIFGPIRHSVYS